MSEELIEKIREEVKICNDAVSNTSKVMQYQPARDIVECAIRKASMERIERMLDE